MEHNLHFFGNPFHASFRRLILLTCKKQSGRLVEFKKNYNVLKGACSGSFVAVCRRFHLI